MNKTLSAALSSVIMIAVYFGLATAYQGCGKNQEAEELTTGEKAVQVADTYTQESYFEDDNGQPATEEESGETGVTTTDSEADPGEVDYVAPPAEQRPATVSNASGRYLVVAGNYLVRSNAESMVSRLERAGYDNAEMTVFDLSQYYTVIAGRFDTRSNANSASTQLKGMGIDNYVLTKK